MAKQLCPKTRHFHVVCNDVMEIENQILIIEATDPNEALMKVIKQLSDSWEGSIEINDHKTMAANQLPLLDFWRTPFKK